MEEERWPLEGSFNKLPSDHISLPIAAGAGGGAAAFAKPKKDAAGAGVGASAGAGAFPKPKKDRMPGDGAGGAGGGGVVGRRFPAAPSVTAKAKKIRSKQNKVSHFHPYRPLPKRYLHHNPSRQEISFSVLQPLPFLPWARCLHREKVQSQIPQNRGQNQPLISMVRVLLLLAFSTPSLPPLA